MCSHKCACSAGFARRSRSALVFEQLEQRASSFSDDPAAALAQLDDLAQTQLAQVSKLVTDPAPAPAPSPAPGPAPAHGAVAPDRAGREQQIRAAGTRELGQLDAALARQLADLQRSFGAELGKLDRTIAGEQDHTADDAAGKDDSLASSIKAEGRRNQADLQREQTRNSRAVAGQQGQLQRAGETERDWHAATFQDIAEDQPQIDAQVQATRALGAPSAMAATALASAQAATAGGDARRSQRAHAIGATTSAQITLKAEVTAQQLAADGAAMMTGARTRMAQSQQAISLEEGVQDQRIQTQAEVATAEMQLHAELARTRMQAERASFGQQAAGAGAAATAAMTGERAATGARGEALQAETAGKLRATHARERAAVEHRTAQLLADLAATPDRDLARTAGKLRRELRSLDASDGAADGAMKSLAKRGARGFGREVGDAQGRVRAEGARARRAIQVFVADARKRILGANKSTAAAIAGAGKRGREAIGSVGADARHDLVAYSEKRHGADVTQAANDLDKIEADGAAAAGAITGLATGVVGRIDDAWVTDAVAAAGAQLDGSSFFGPSADEARGGMRALTQLPPHLQGRAVGQLTGDQFTAMLETVPEADREGLDSLVHATTDPARKLQLWGAYHKAHAKLDVARHRGDTADPEQQRRHDNRTAAAAHTGGELDEEVAFLEAQAKAGKPFSAADVDSLMQRKGREHAMEMAYNTNLTNLGGARITGPNTGSHIHWSLPELEVLDGAFAALPEAHMAGNKLLKEVRREETTMMPDPADSTKQVPNPTFVGWHSGGKITMMDGGSQVSGFGMRNGGDARELADPALVAKSPAVTPFEMTVVHEIGHDIHDQHPAEFAAYQKAAGWKQRASLAGSVPAAEIAKLDATRSNADHTSRNSFNDHAAGKLYEINPYGGGYYEVDNQAIPTAAQSKVTPGNYHDPWDYARSNPLDHFAEHYAKAVEVPERVYADLVEQPQHDADLARQEVASLVETRNMFTTMNMPPGSLRVIEERLVAARAARDTKERAEKSRGAQYAIMRDDVFHADDAQRAAEARLTARSVPAAKLDEFKAKAARASTPAQIAQLEAQY